MLYNLIITPIETIVGWTFFFFKNKFDVLGPAGAIIGVSLVINFLALPLYNIADALQDKERKVQKSLEYRVKRIKKGFKGDEQFMMLQTYYRQNNYHPLYALRSSLSILIEIPFFIAAYHYLSNCEAIKEVSFLFLKDLGSPDKAFAFNFGNHIFYINILPILMTVINIISGAVYSKEAPAREKIQIYVLAGIFLVLLYNSPSGLVFYWILNNLFSLAKNIIKKFPSPGKILHIIISVLFILFTIFFFITRTSRLWKKALLIVITLAICLIPLEIKFLKKIMSRLNLGTTKVSENKKSQLSIFLLSCFGMALLCGFVLPSSVISSSPIEFSFLGKTNNPINYIYTSFVVFAGLFILWPLIIYKLFNDKIKTILTYSFFTIIILSLINVFFLKSSYGELNAFFILSNTNDIESISLLYFVIPIIVICISIGLYFILKKYNKQIFVSMFLIAICISEIILGIIKTKTVYSVYINYSKNIVSEQEEFVDTKIKPFYHLSKDKKNIVVVFLDRATNTFFNRAIEQYPELKKSYEGFVYFPNTVSFGVATDSGSPAMMGGYEYTPENMNLRESEPLVTKHNEATLVMPKLFLDAGYEVTVTDPPWPNYEWKGDLSAFKQYPEIHVTELANRYSTIYSMEKDINLFKDPDKKCSNNIRNFSVLQILIPLLREFFYKNCYKEDYFYKEFIDDISSLHYLPELTDFNSAENTYTFIDNETPHNRYAMDAPNFDKPVDDQDNYSDDIKQFHTNIASYKKLAVWLDYLRDNDCYDNTRIIVVSDHGSHIGIEEFKEVDSKTDLAEKISCILLFKDFNSNNPLSTDNTFMTNADTLYLAKKDIDAVSDINPFTHKKLVQEKENGITAFETIDNPMNHTQTKFNIKKDSIYHVNGDVRNPDNWIKVEE